MKFRQKQLLVDAVQLLWSTWSEMCELTNGYGCTGCYVDDADNVTEDTNGRIGLKIPMLPTGSFRLAVENDWVVRELIGELRVYSHVVFVESFEPANDDPNRVIVHEMLLGDALRRTLVRVGVIGTGSALTGPELIAIAEKYCETP